MQKEKLQSTEVNQQNNQANQEQEEITAQTVEQFNKVCKDATQLMLSYKKQSEDLKNQITSMVTIYNKNASPNQAVPVQKIIEITNVYQIEMKNAHNEYEHLQQQLKKQQEQRNDMIVQISKCFEKLQKMEKILKQRKAKQVQSENTKEKIEQTSKQVLQEKQE